MRKYLPILALAAGLGLAGCTQATKAVSSVCTDIAGLPSTVTTLLNAQDPHSAFGVLWADAKAGCANGAPVAGVTPDWIGMVWGEMKTLAPMILPVLIGLL